MSSGKTAFVTGGSRGIGRAVVRRLAAEGYAVGIDYLQAKDQAEALEAELRDFCNQRLAEYKWVRLVELVEEMPKTISGKVQKGLQRRE